MPLPPSLVIPFGGNIQPVTQSQSVWVPIANITITDTNTHTYQTDPVSATSGTGIAIPKIGNILGTGESQISAYSIYIYNNENQILTVQPITNIVSDGSLPDMNLTSSYNINPGNSDIHSFDFKINPVEYISVYLSYATAPTAGVSSVFPQAAVYGVVFLYYGD
ncbi:MAG: hypothetical protein QW478_12795 [Candidatus Micrarchaeaceae archaeon]